MTGKAPGDVVLIYAAIVNSDGNEGRGYDRVLAYFWSVEDAKAYGRGKDVMGSDGNVKECQAVIDGQMRLWVGKPVQVLGLSRGRCPNCGSPDPDTHECPKPWLCCADCSSLGLDKWTGRGVVPKSGVCGSCGGPWPKRRAA
jgi:hypothetical protein